MTTIFMSPFLVLGTWYLGIGTSPPWSGSGTGEHRRRRGGGASEASQETTVDSPRSYGPRPLGTSCHSPTPLTASWGGKSSAPAAGPSNTSPPWSSSGTGEHRRRRGGGASEASQKTTVDSLRSCGPRPLGTSCHSPTPLTASWGRNPLPQRQGRPTPLPRGAAAERGSTAGGGEGARAKRARKPPWFPCGPADRAPSALRATPPLR